jgi:hypothetical protein
LTSQVSCSRLFGHWEEAMNHARIASLIFPAVLTLITPSPLPATEEWQFGPESTFELWRFDAEFDPWSGFVLFPGGRLADGSTDGSVWVYDPATLAFADSGVDLPTPVSNYTANLVEISNATGLFIVGGRTASGTLIDTVQYYNPKINDASALGPEDDYPGSGPSNGALNSVYGNRIYVAGGFQTARAPYHSEETWVFDYSQPAGSRWTRLVSAALVPARSYLMSAVVDGRIYAIGGAVYDGFNLNPVTDVQVLDPAAVTPAWTSVAPLPEACSSGQAWGFDSTFQGTFSGGRLAGKIITTCGFWPDENDRVYLYDTHTDTWEPYSSMRIARREQAAAFLPLPNAPIIAMWGGRSGSDNNVLTESEFITFGDSPCKILLVDDDLQAGSLTQGGSPYYQRALLQAAWDYAVWDVASQGSPALPDLESYPTVVWFTGNDRDTCVSPSEEAALVAYLEGGGNLILSSPEQVRAQGLSPLLTDQLGVASVSEDVAASTVEGTPLGSAVTPLGPYVLTRPSLWANYWSGSAAVDTVSATAGVHQPLEYPGIGLPAATQAVFDPGVPRNAVFLGFPLEWINSTAERAELLGTLLEWTSCPVFRDGLESGDTVRWSATNP